ncbi:hypothetical protein [Salinarimonas sp.]|uniref:hypothetical protein n=1 Tax=Salinarimonas sp. TaxID=2766526 RepID=UPI003919D3E1
MTVAELRKALDGLSDDAPVCIAELDEAFGTRIESAEIVEKARIRSDDAADVESVDLTGGSDRALVLRYA